MILLADRRYVEAGKTYADQLHTDLIRRFQPCDPVNGEALLEMLLNRIADRIKSDSESTPSEKR